MDFVLQKSPSAEKFFLSFVGETGNSPPEIEKEIEYIGDGVHAMAFGCWHLYGKFLWDWPDQEGFQLKSISLKELDGRKLVRVEFDYQPTDRKKIRLADVFVECDPAKDWCLSEFGSTLSDGTTKSITTVSTQAAEGYTCVLPAKITTTITSGETGKTTFKRTVDVKILSGDKITDEEFYLTHYGLPEPNFESKPFPMWLMYLIAGIGCLAAAYFWRRRQATVSQVA